eukprot:1170114-Rhodomonas_salina.2
MPDDTPDFRDQALGVEAEIKLDQQKSTLGLQVVSEWVEQELCLKGADQIFVGDILEHKGEQGLVGNVAL